MAPTAADAVLCGDPARALAIAQHVIAEPRMSNHHRGLWGYFGLTAAGRQLTVHATGIGGPSAAVVLDELARRGLRRAVRVGTASAEAGPPIGASATVRAVVAGDGASAAWGAEPGERLTPDPGLTERLSAATEFEVTVESSDRPRPEIPIAPGPPLAGKGAPPVSDLQTAALFAAGREIGVRLAGTIVVARGSEGPLEDDPLESVSLRLAAIATRALGAEADISSSTAF